MTSTTAVTTSSDSFCWILCRFSFVSRLIVVLTHVQTKQGSGFIHYLIIKLIIALNIRSKVMQTHVCVCVDYKGFNNHKNEI